jgi:S-adenosylmethionine-diacylglycerol 3-amino-3-carboxypropyl transferase
MSRIGLRLERLEFEGRMIVSFGVVLAVCAAAFLGSPSAPPLLVSLGARLHLDPAHALRAGYLCVAGVMVLASGLRMWAGSALTSGRAMAFPVQADALTLAGPYRLVRNPMYLADFVAACGFALCLPPVGVVLPATLLLHYTRLIRYEERALAQQFDARYRAYTAEVPPLFPDLRAVRRLRAAVVDLVLTWDGVRHNAPYVLFVPGFVLAALTGSLGLAVLVGLPAVLDWAVVHTRKGVAPRPSAPATAVALRPAEAQARSKVFDGVLYAQCWEDPAIDREAFQIGPDDVVFSITSGGCNVLAFLIDDPRRVIALDVNPHQNYLLDLKLAAFARLEHPEVLALLGVAPSDRRRTLYAALRPRLRADSRRYWDAHARAIEDGVIHAGRYERYLRLLRRWFGVLMGRSLAAAVLAAPSAEARRALFRRRWDTRRWRLFTDALLSRRVMTCLFDGAFFAQLEESFSFGERFRARVEHAVLELPVERNPYLAYVLLGLFPSPQHLPLYLRPEHFEAIRRRVDRIELVTGACEEYFGTLPSDAISKFNFTNVFEWMPARAFEALLRETVRVARPGAVMTYRNLLVPRARPDSLAAWIRPERALAAALHARDLSFVYGAYVVERISKQEGECPTVSSS